MTRSVHLVNSVVNRWGKYGCREGSVIFVWMNPDNDTIVNPKVVLEVLSKSTAAYDRSDKFHAYWSLESFEEYVLIDQYRVHVEYFRRQSEKMWELNVFTKIEDVLSLNSIEVDIPLREIYQSVVWDG